MTSKSLLYARKARQQTFVLLDSGSSNRTSNEPCNSPSCPTWSSWSIASACSTTCGNGTQLLTSNCVYNGELIVPSCDGDYQTRHQLKLAKDHGRLLLFLDGGNLTSNRSTGRSCNTQSCPTWSSWSESSPCSVTCDGGIEQFSSTCIYHGEIAAKCNGKIHYH